MFLVALTSCRKNVDEVTTTETPFVPPIVEAWQQLNVPVNGSLTGFVADEAGVPVTGANIKVGNLATTTDDFGHFFFEGVTMNARGTLVQVEKEGYFPGSRRFFAVKDVENRIKIELLAKNFDQSFDAQAGATISMNGGATVEFSANSIQSADGSLYSGTVKVAAKWLDPTSPRTFDQMPGNLQGINQDNEEVVLGTAGMVAVELQGENGEKLNILEGSTATIKSQMPAALLANAPSEIPLWSYNEEYGIWVEEGTSKLENGFYVAEVSHFSFWNHDFPTPLVEFSAIIVDEDGNALANYQVLIRQPGTYFYGTGYTCGDGSISGLIPQNEALELQIFDICGEVIHSENIAPFANNTDLGTITVPASTLNATTITGELVDCDGNPVGNGLLIITFGGNSVYEYTDGSPFEVLFSVCSSIAEVEITGVDLDDLLQSDPLTATANGTTDVNQITVCNQQLQNYIRVSADGGLTYTLYTEALIRTDSTGAGVVPYFSFSDNSNPAGGAAIGFGINGIVPGNYDDNNFIEIFSDPANNWNFAQGQKFDTFTLDEYGAVGEPVKATFGGTFTNWDTQPPTTVSITGDLNIIRQQ